jgi:hypothetical protein
MLLDSQKIIHLFRYFWLLLALSCALYILSQNIIHSRDLSYQLDLQESINKNLEGLYPSLRTSYQADTQSLQILAEPLYLQAYLPVKFKQVQLSGRWLLNNQSLDIGLKQKDDTWVWQKVNTDDFVLTFSLDNAKITNNKLEFIFSLPNLTVTDKVMLKDLLITLKR